MHDFPAAQSIFLKCVDQEGLIILFKIKPTTKLGKLTTAFCRRFDVEEYRVNFFVCGERIAPDDTAEKLGLQDGDFIDVEHLCRL